MAKNKVYVTVRYGGNFKGGPPLEYIGGRADVAEISLSKPSLSSIMKLLRLWVCVE